MPELDPIVLRGLGGMSPDQKIAFLLLLAEQSEARGDNSTAELYLAEAVKIKG